MEVTPLETGLIIAFSIVVLIGLMLTCLYCRYPSIYLAAVRCISCRNRQSTPEHQKVLNLWRVLPHEITGVQDAQVRLLNDSLLT